MKKGKWSVTVSGKAKKAKRNLPPRVYEAYLIFLIMLENGPKILSYPNYGKLGDLTYHCHLKKGRPTYVACWTADKKNKIIEVYYAGTHEKAPY